jgi:hypothetical protein
MTKPTKKKTETLYKVLHKSGRAPMGHGSWPLPKDGKPGDWLEVRGTPVLCLRGLHLTNAKYLGYWVDKVRDCSVWVRNLRKSSWDGKYLSCDRNYSVFEVRVSPTAKSVGGFDGRDKNTGDIVKKIAVSKARLVRKLSGAEVKAIIKEEAKKVADAQYLLATKSIRR